MIVQLEKGVLRRARAVRNHDFGGNLCFWRELVLFCHVIAYYYFFKVYQVWYVFNIIDFLLVLTCFNICFCLE